MKKRDGIIYEEFVTASSHHFKNGKLSGHIHMTEDGDYTGKFWFEYPEGKQTKKYTRKTAPKWLIAMLDEATVEDDKNN